MTKVISKEAIKSLKDKASSKSVKNIKADSITKAALVKKITEKKDLTYKYPADCDDLGKRKIFRAKIRKGLQKLEKQLKLSTKGKIDDKPEAIEKQIAAFRKEHYHQKA